MREYGKLHTSFWTSEDIRRLSDDGRMLAAYLLTGPHTTMIGCFRLPDGYVAEDLGWTSQRVTKGFAELLSNGFATRCEQSKWVVLHRFLKWNRIENPNQAKAAAQCFEQIPPTSTVKLLAAKAIEQYGERINRAVIEPFLNGSERVTQTLPEPETGTGTETGELAVRSSTLPPVAVVAIPLNDGTDFEVTSEQLDEFQALYPAVDVLAQLRSCRGWNLANPRNRKTRSGALKHINAWLSKQQNGERPQYSAPRRTVDADPFAGSLVDAQ